MDGASILFHHGNVHKFTFSDEDKSVDFQPSCPAKTVIEGLKHNNSQMLVSAEGTVWAVLDILLQPTSVFIFNRAFWVTILIPPTNKLISNLLFDL